MFLKIFPAVETGIDVIGTDNLDSTTDEDEGSEYCFVQY